MADEKKCVVDGCESFTVAQVCQRHWFMTPLAFRKRWWQETDYSKLEPSENLVAEINKIALDLTQKT